VTEPIQIHHFENGLVLLVERMRWLESAAFSLAVPAGCVYDPAALWGVGNFTCEMVQRGCGSRNSRQFLNDLENLGIDHSSNVSTAHTSFAGAMPADRLEPALAIYADLVQRPHLPSDQLEDARLVCLQEIHGLEDDLAQRAMMELKRRRYGDPYGRYSQGTLETVQDISLADVASHFESNYGPRGAILSIAGNVDFPRVRDQIGELFGNWQTQPSTTLAESAPELDSSHLQHESSQTHIAVAFDSVPYAHPDYYQARGAVGVLSDGMSSRLFTEVRENRGLVYSVYASCHSLRDRANVFCYAGTSTDRAQETLDVLLHELRKLAEGVQEDELQRLKARLKSALVMHQESSAARCHSMAGDWYHLQRVQSLEEVGRRVDELTTGSINAYLSTHPPDHFTVVTLGQEKLEIPVDIS
jgi:predicted Zn-dependent peptidase